LIVRKTCVEDAEKGVPSDIVAVLTGANQG
jgi:hypothetical protein